MKEPTGLSGRELNDPSLTVVVPTYKRPQYVANVLRGLAQQEELPEEVLVVTVRGDKETALVVQRELEKAPLSGRGKVLEIGHAGYLEPVMAAFWEASGEIVSLIDDDAFPTRDWVKAVRRAFAGNPGLGALAGRVVNVKPGSGPFLERPRRRIGCVLWPGIPLTYFSSPPRKWYRREAALARGANFSVLRRVARTFLPHPAFFDGDARHYEAAICLSIIRQGYRVEYDPNVVVWHFSARERQVDRNDTARLAYYAGRNWMLAYVPNAPWHSLPFFLIYWFLWGRGDSSGLGRGLLLTLLRGSPGLTAVIAGLRGRLDAIRLLGLGGLIGGGGD